MSSDEGSILDQARQHHRKQLNALFRRPGMYGRDEIAELLLLGAMAAVDGSSARWETEFDSLRNHFFSATGVKGRYSNLLPTDAVRDAAASVYAGIAHRCGWLDLDRTMSAAEYRQLTATIDERVLQDQTLSQVIGTFGEPSLWVGGRNSLGAKTLGYATASSKDDLICFHLWSAIATTDPDAGPQSLHPEPVVLAVRHRTNDAPYAFSFTPEGLRRRPTTDQQSPLRPTVWIFHGDQARHASAVFETEEAGLAWAGEHHVTGILAEYPYGGAYDIALSEGRFTPSQSHHGTTDHVAAFAPGLRHLHLVDGQPD
ncbi:DUF7710 domain-containing protein [Couchioplanes caeruleus]|uniref:DUF7710 domain-containing protein n=1 Tax=Couchioplanes caeruleus TaxID=56438 RepID=A0A3N1GT74_9ACTN|nr:hypothetical protein [Couchioplanes caeruleus]ROP33460.1 hypothetical protein EDD30_6444 [Couchioplanes caeruleus]